MAEQFCVQFFDEELVINPTQDAWQQKRSAERASEKQE